MTTLPLSLTIIAVPVLVILLGVFYSAVGRIQDRFGFGKAADVDLFAPQEAEGL